MTIRIANGAGFWGDDTDAPRRLVEAADVNYLTLEYLAELTMSIMARQRQKDPAAGFASDFVSVLADIAVPIQNNGLRIVTNAGGLSPKSCAVAAARALHDAGLNDVTIGIVSGDDLLSRFDQLRMDGHDFSNMDTGAPADELPSTIVCANAYLGTQPIVEALDAGAQVVITGRVADAALVVGPAMHEFGWQWDDWQRLAAASVAGHLVECGAQVTGGYSTNWRLHDLVEIGYPIAEIDDQSNVVITKPADSGGAVNRHTVAEQLVYEIGDPANYVTPDVTVDFTTVELAELADDRVAVRGATGQAPPESYKVSLAYAAGFMASGQVLVYGTDCVAKARITGELILDRLAAAGYEPKDSRIELLGAGDGVPCNAQPPTGLQEVVMRISIHDPNRDVADAFVRQFAPLVTNGPAGIAGYTNWQPTIRPVNAYWPTTIAKDVVQPQVEVRAVAEWLTEEGAL
jgi:hypothetical protein